MAVKSICKILHRRPRRHWREILESGYLRVESQLDCAGSNIVEPKTAASPAGDCGISRVGILLLLSDMSVSLFFFCKSPFMGWISTS